MAPGRAPRLLFEAARRAVAMGIIEPGSVARGDLADVRHLAIRVRRAGIAAAAADELSNVAVPARADVAELLELMIGALEASPVPKFEWIGLGRVFDAEDLAALLNISASSLKRYEHGERTTPDPIAARLHFLALVVGDLAGSYNNIGIRRWFQRKRSLLGGRTPTALLTGEWDPEDEAPARVRTLARELTTLTAT